VAQRKPGWVQGLVIAILLLMVDDVVLAYLNNRVPGVSAWGVWSSLLAAPVVLAIVVFRWHGQHPSRLAVVAVGVVTYGVAGVIARGYAADAISANIPIMVVMRGVYPAAGVIWGLLLHQAIEQGYVPFFT
jgi:hypothetical protein